MTPTNPPQYSISEILDTLLGEWGASPAFEKDQLGKAKQAIEAYTLSRIVDEFKKLDDDFQVNSQDLDRDGYSHQVIPLTDLLNRISELNAKQGKL